MLFIDVLADFDEDFVDADLEVTAQLGLASDNAQLRVELLEGKTTVVSQNIDFTAPTGGTLTEAKKVTIPVAAPKHWDAEHPNLYTLRTSLIVNGVEKQVNEEKVGFREIHYGGRDGTDINRIYVNGKEVKLRGTCRHDVSDDLGRSMTREEAYKEAEAYKKANINFIRTSHYPASEDLLDACDEMGIYVEQEAAVCFQGPWADVASKYEDYGPQFTEMVERDRNRSSILIWSLGNESNYAKVKAQSGGDAFGDERAYLEDVDRTRPCIFSFPNTGEPEGLMDIYSVHYANVTGGLGSSTMPQLHDEYAHIACYNLDELQRDVNVRNFWGESVKIAWENIFETDGALGGALWGGIDDVFYIPDGTSERWQSHSSGQTAGYGEWGSVLDAYLREKPEAYLTKKAYSPIRVDEDNCYISEETLYIPVKNWFDHTDMNEVKLRYSVDEAEAKEVSVTESIEPHSEGTISVSGISGKPESVNLKFYTADGVMVDEYQVALSQKDYSFLPAGGVAPTITDGENEITVSGEKFSLVFDKTTGLISEAAFGEAGSRKTMLTGGPYLHVTGMTLGDWIPDETEGVQAAADGDCAAVTLKGSYANGQGVQFDLRISGNGIIAAEYTLTTAPAKGSGFSEVGISYDIPSDIESVSWQRNSLYSAYPEEHIGRSQGTALKERKDFESKPDQYGVEPAWPWKDDMKNYFVWATEDLRNGLATNDFRAMRENIHYYNVNYGKTENMPRISVESEKANVSARVALTVDLGYLDDRDPRIQYTGSWDTYEAGSDYAGTEHFSSKVGDSCELEFTGTGIRFIGSKQKNTGKVKIYIDDVFKEEVDTYSNLGNDLKQAVIYSIEDLTEGKHTIKLETSGGNANCVVVDAFEILSGADSSAKVEAKLVVDQQWYYPNLGWGNYVGKAGTLAEGTKGSVTVRLTDQDNFVVKTVPSLSRVRVTEEKDGTLKASYGLRDETAQTKVKLQWYRVRIGDPDSKKQLIEGVTGETCPTKGWEANRIFCTVSLEEDGNELASVNSNVVEVGKGTYRYRDILTGLEEFTFEGTIGTDVKTDVDKSWTANAYGKSVTYLLETKNPASVTYKFEGKGIRWIGGKENNQGIAEVIIDGGEPEEVDLYGPAGTGGQINEVLYERIWDEAGSHTIKISRTGRKNTDSLAANVSLDAFIVVGALPAKVEGVKLDTAELELAVGDSRKLTATVWPDDAVNPAVVFTTSNPQVATVEPDGTVNAVGVGEAVITVTTEEGGFTASCSVKVSGKPVRVEGVSLDAYELELAIGQSRKLKATVLPENAVNRAIAFTSDNSDVAVVEADGTVKAAGVGETVVTVTTEEGGFTAACRVTVLSVEEALSKAQEEAKKAQEEAEAARKEAEAAQKAVEEAQKRALEAQKQADEKARAAAASQAATEQQRREAQAAKHAAEMAQKELAAARVELAKAQAEARAAKNKADKLEFQARKTTLSKIISKKKKTVKVTWKKVSGAAGYQVQYALKSNLKGKKTLTVKGGKKTSGTIKKLKSGKKYYVLVRAYKKIGSQNIYSGFSKTKSIKVK